MSYECHVTVENDPARREQFERLADAHGWKTSAIDGDPVLGPGVNFYFTCHHEERAAIFFRMRMLEVTLKALMIPVKRSKIKHIIYDDRR